MIIKIMLGRNQSCERDLKSNIDSKFSFILESLLKSEKSCLLEFYWRIFLLVKLKDAYNFYY